jgi:hypothetical protein
MLEQKQKRAAGNRSEIHQINGRHEETRTPDLYRVNSEVNNLKPFACLAFPCITYLKTPQKQPIFGDELVTSFLFHSLGNVVVRVD